MATEAFHRTHCDFSCTDRLCLTLDKAGVPTDPKWRTLILYMRSLGEYHTLTDSQKNAIQNLVVSALKRRNFSDAEFQRIIKCKQEILGEPCNSRLKSALAETVALVEEFGSLLGKRSNDVAMLGRDTVAALESGEDPLEMVARIRHSFKTVVHAMEEDASQLRTMSYTDALTGIGNRRAFDEQLDLMIRRWMEQGEPGCLLFLDIDHFKQFNDAHGHRIGDQALTMVGRILQSYVDQAGHMLDGPCHAFRYGGEEFAVLFQNTALPAALAHADTLRTAVRKCAFVIRDPQGQVLERNMRITVSGGVATLLPDWQDAIAAHLVDAADRALYRAKHDGRDKILPHEASSPSMHTSHGASSGF
ncbi:GGDEF domain-containing protein [Megalodesulfovibrio paquesii]